MKMENAPEASRKSFAGFLTDVCWLPVNLLKVDRAEKSLLALPNGVANIVEPLGLMHVRDNASAEITRAAAGVGGAT
jgi:hypothetical protein